MKISKLTRKDALHRLALNYSNANSDRGADSFSFEDGYQAAMRDLRTALKDPSKHFAIVVRDFLRPIR